MKLETGILLLAVTFGVSAKGTTTACHSFPSSMVEFSSSFEQPHPPLVKTEFKTSFIQHKWNTNLSHITSGYMYFSPSQGVVRVDEAYDGVLATSVFNYANVTKEGLVENTMTLYSGNSASPTVWSGYVMSDFPLFPGDILIKERAVFGGLVNRDLLEGQVASWDIMYDSIPVTLYVDACNVIVGYDYFSPRLRTRVTTEFFNTFVGPVKL